eukprot:TRINITY_DN54760_c0_g1_i1.p2 TRINITY_DN54760_c0_g1~~TRINITY_DN54760_c0_g1_i1.p2  ORF type:complete len:143 (+),score=17.19 TRINITY_DN54760_c0_g1_i1:54-482(+)
MLKALVLFSAQYLCELAFAFHAAFVLPPASPAGAMLPVACGLLEAGHNVSILAWDDQATKFHKMLPGAEIIGLGPAARPQLGKERMRFLIDLPYEVMSFFVSVLILGAFDLLAGLPLAEAALPRLTELRPDVICVTPIIPRG